MLFFSLWLSFSAQASVCCGGGIILPSLLVSGETRQFTLSALTAATVVDNVDSAGYWRTPREPKDNQTFIMSAAYAITERWQLGFSLPVVRRSENHRSQTQGVADTILTTGFEIDASALPFNARSWLFVQTQLPTGLPRVRGRGFWALGPGVALTQNLGAWDSLTTLEVHRSLPRTVDSVAYQPGWGGQLQVGLGYTWRSWRWGVTSVWLNEDPIRSEGSFFASGGVERSATVSAQATHFISARSLVMLGAFDQTVLGAPVNTALTRGLSLTWQQRWD